MNMNTFSLPGAAKRWRLLGLLTLLFAASLVAAGDARSDYYNCAAGLVNTGTADDQANGSACSYWLLPSFPLGGSSRPDLNGTSVPGLDVLPVWRTTRGAGVTVAVVDTGVDGNSEDLRPNLVAGWNFYDGNADTRDAVGHGTVIASIIAAPANNGGYVGIAPEAHILPVKIMGEGEFSNAAAVAGIRYAITHGARVVNASFGALNEPIPGMDAALRAARQADVLVVIAAGNSGVDLDSGRNTESPNGYGLSNALTVANFSNHGHLNSDSNFGARHVQIAGIGETLWGDYPDYFGGGYLGGTSAAAATASGVAALLFSAYPTATAEQVRAAIITGANHNVPSLVGKVEANGLLSASGALAAIAHPIPSSVLPLTGGSAPILVTAPRLARANKAGLFAAYSGRFRVGQRLGTSVGTWRGLAGLKLRISWQRCDARHHCEDVYAANARFYGNGGNGTILGVDRGSSLVATITAVNAQGRETAVTTRSTGLILASAR